MVGTKKDRSQEYVQSKSTAISVSTPHHQIGIIFKIFIKNTLNIYRFLRRLC